MTAASPTRARSAFAASTGAVLAGLAVVVTSRTLPLPSDLHPARLATWASDVGPTMATFTALRALGAALLGWMVLTASAGVVARRLRSASATRAIDRVSLPVVRRFANGVAGAALVAATLTSTVPAGAQSPPTTTRPAVVTMHDVGPTSSEPDAVTQEAAPVAPLAPALAPSPTLPPISAPADAPTMQSPAPVTMRALDPMAPPAAGSPGSTWVVAPGDTLWHVAERVVADRTGRRAEPTDTLAELDRLVAANADRLVVPGNPDLVFPGQELRLP
jgi:hypothetical protein